jgi:hypothetical protein
MKTSELTGAALDWAVAKCEGRGFVFGETDYTDGHTYQRGTAQATGPHYSTDWGQGGPIIERECIGLRGPSIRGNAWAAFIDLSGISQGPQHRHTGPTPLIAAMRCYVASKLGDVVNVPEELV